MINNTFYFAQDGSYGLWENGSMLINTSQWTSKDWALIEECSDSERTTVARIIMKKHMKTIGGII
jgi:hypothetical protein